MFEEIEYKYISEISCTDSGIYVATMLSVAIISGFFIYLFCTRTKKPPKAF